MAWADFGFDPTDGLANTVSFPTDPADETAARAQFMTILNQIKDFLNGTVKTENAVTASETVVGKVELATAAETTTGTDNTRAVHPAGLKVELDKKLALAGGTLTGVVAAKTGTDYTTKQIRNIRFKATDDFTTDDLGTGEIGFVYTP